MVVFEGGGKGGVIEAITERVSPRVFRVVALPALASARIREYMRCPDRRFFRSQYCTPIKVLWIGVG